ncbi:6-carboxytetrahydropterin synthase [Crocinitomicaceae bacterium]|uniref:6-carboxy-5,6,7,8-tetrahydropterin synthase n=1 Tax=uncultured Flavobacteriia bacterium TaxID=212695 RepID=H6RGD7_9BACT|nr:6-pyruvoyl tetrahydropterin synthase [uncultured bacterium]MDB0062963.1 6-carboxytetrahydropterin synthase [Crocinitomicaceae bacterium]CCG00098.1 6-pyruvoyl tetrahydrobiopterin synthase [uncultured Flavobacteriia bacterium]MDC1194284.1 6-carboxytetrahydropterin synthase [Crocinitomicaceae bacterium]MDG1346809.1 6-carboxytetrahydropterin synthase [Crocinitomicaceae bacterium]
MKVGRRETFNSAHRLFHPDWSDEKNLEVFGKCSNPNYHGHNYVLETWVEGPIDPVTGFVMDLKLLKNLIRTEVTDKFDHRNLNLDIDEFKDLNPTAENIAKVAWELISVKLPTQMKLTVRLWETENNIVEYSGK